MRVGSSDPIDNLLADLMTIVAFFAAVAAVLLVVWGWLA